MQYKIYDGKSYADIPSENIPEVLDYCITGIDRNNPGNHCASEFHLWQYKIVTIKNETKHIWEDRGWVSSSKILDILCKKTDKLYSAEEYGEYIHTGEKIEPVFRVTHNGSNFDLSKMPGKPRW